MSSIYITTYSDASCTTPSGNPLTIGFNENKLTNTFDVTYDSELPIPPPPPDSNGNPLTTSYITQLYVNVSDGVNNNIPAFTYYIDASSTTVTTLNLAVRNETANGSPVTFKYDKTGLDTIFGTLNITNGSWTLNLVDGSVTGSNGPTVDVQTNDVKVTIPVLGESQFYTMNVEKYVAGILSETIVLSSTADWNLLSVPGDAIISVDDVNSISNAIYIYTISNYEPVYFDQQPQVPRFKCFWVQPLASNVNLRINYNNPYIPPVSGTTDTITIPIMDWFLISVPGKATVSVNNIEGISNAIYGFNKDIVSYDPALYFSDVPVLHPYKGYWVQTLAENIVITIQYIN